MIANLTARQVSNLYAALGRVSFVESKYGPVKGSTLQSALTVGAPTSLDALLDADAAGVPVAGVSRTAAPDREMQQVLTRHYAEQCLSDLRAISPKQEVAVRAYYGVDCDRPRSVRELAAEWGVSRQAVEQTIQRGLANLRNLYGVTVN